jgi:hypothetical protein
MNKPKVDVKATNSGTLTELADADLDLVTGGQANGTTVAEFNHNSGPFGASGNPNASAGPGFFLKQDTHFAVLAVLQPPGQT